MSEPRRGPLDGVTVLELGHIVAGPTASLMLAELGADVIKIERPGSGDQARLSKGNLGHFISYNSNKRSVALDIQTEDGKQDFLRLVEVSDILIDNFAPGALDRLGLGYDVLSTRNPQLIHGSIKGFLPGPYGQRPLTDEPAQMMGGLAYMTGPMGRPLRAGTSVVDITGAMFAVVAILAALHEREETGVGRQVRIGLFESVVFLVGQHIAKASLKNEVPVPMPERGMGRDLGWGIYRIFTTRDNRAVFVAVLSNSHWERFCDEFQLKQLWDDPGLRTTNGRAEQHERLGRLTEELMGSMTFAETVERLEKAGLPFAPVNTPYDLLNDPHLRSIEFLEEVNAPNGGKGFISKLPIVSDGWFGGSRTDPPALGSDTEDVLAEIAARSSGVTA
jgi:crotonobetainyl-CoA:carnitine CoA-transferase CaiB-like acyl-CoA transferase